MGAAFKVLRDWPALLDVEEAVEYSGLAPSEISRASKDGRLVFKALGPQGRKVVPRGQLDNLLNKLWSDQRGEPIEDMDFGDD